MEEKNKYIFIIGNSRSGTTMLSNILGKYDSAYVFKELHFFDVLSKGIGINETVSFAKGIELYSKLLASNILEPWNSNQYRKFTDLARKDLSNKNIDFKKDVLKLFFDTILP